MIGITCQGIDPCGGNGGKSKSPNLLPNLRVIPLLRWQLGKNSLRKVPNAVEKLGPARHRGTHR